MGKQLNIFNTQQEAIVDVWFSHQMLEDPRQHEITRIDDKFYFKYNRSVDT